MATLQFSEYRDTTADLLASFDAGEADQHTWSAKRRDEICEEIDATRSLQTLEFLLDGLADDAMLLTPQDAATVAAFAGKHAWTLRHHARRVALAIAA